MDETTCKFGIGQLVHHRLFDYRGVIVDVDATFQGTEEWYQQVARSRPPKEQPWYYVLVDKAQHTTYVAERNLEPDRIQDPIEHPLVDSFPASSETATTSVCFIEPVTSRPPSCTRKGGSLLFHFSEK